MHAFSFGLNLDEGRRWWFLTLLSFSSLPVPGSKPMCLPNPSERAGLDSGTVREKAEGRKGGKEGKREGGRWIMDGWMKGWMDGWVDGWMNGDGWMDEWMDGWVDG